MVKPYGGGVAIRLQAFSCVVVSTATLAVPGCRFGAPDRTTQDSTKTIRRAVVPLEILTDTLAICQLDSTQPLPPWARLREDEFLSVTRTRDELSIILAQSRAPAAVKCERNWRAFKVRGPLDFNQVGIIAGLSGTLADAGVSIFALSTYDTDYVLVKQGDLERAAAALRRAGYPVAHRR
jgi:hypothetical protein